MKNSFRSSLKKQLTLAIAVAVVGISYLWAEDAKIDDSALSFQVHPQVFSIIQGWTSDTKSPVATELNLDAVEKNRNQFSKDEIKVADGWTIFREADVQGFKSYRFLENKTNHYKVEYQENDGGTLTTSSTIEFSVITREIKENDKTTKIRVLRVDGYSSN